MLTLNRSICSMAAAIAVLLLPSLLHAWSKPSSTTRRVPESAPLRPVVDAMARYLDLPTTGVVNMAYTPDGLELTVQELPFLVIRIQPAVTARLTDQHKGALIDLLAGFRLSADLDAAFRRVNAASGAFIEIHYGNIYYDYDGSTPSFGYFAGDDAGHLGYQSVPGDDTAVVPGTIVHVSINEQRFDPVSNTYRTPSAGQFAAALLHELTHLIVPGRADGSVEHSGADEAEVEAHTAASYNALFIRSGVDQLSDAAAPQMRAGLIVRGGFGHDVLTGSSRDDTVGGDYGHDTLYGLEGNDILLGHDDNDTLYGGPGENLLDGQFGHDTYEVEGRYDLIMDEGNGNDALIARHINASSATFFRRLNTLFITAPDGSTIQVDRQWLAAHRIEYFYFADATYSWQQVQALVPAPPTINCPQGRIRVLCHPDY